jgi:hypothetical protein
MIALAIFANVLPVKDRARRSPFPARCSPKAG